MGISIGLKATFPSLGLARQWVKPCFYRLIPTNGIGGGMVLNSPETFAMEEPYLGSLGAGTRLFVRETSFLIPRAGSSMG